MISFVKGFTLLLIIFCAQTLFAQIDTSEVIRLQKQWVNSQNPASDKELHQTFLEYNSNEIAILLKKAKEFQNDSIFSVKWNNLLLVSILAKNSIENNNKSEIGSFLLKSLFDTDTRIRYLAYESLMILENYNFSQNQKDTTLLALKQETNNEIISGLYKLCAEQNIIDAQSYLKEIASSDSTPFYQKWVALSSLVRMGDSEAEETMYYYLSKIGLSLDVINTLYPLVVFSKSKQNVDYLISIIKNDNSECESMNPNYTQTIPCAYYVLKKVAPHIDAINWYSPNGLEKLDYIKAIEEAKKIFNKSNFIWNFKEEQQYRE
ncbi:MAG TPA: hypothetical protein PLV65_05860 [Tenuifilaceae bacterium]|nr:hypothetical protein [Tenuifilaceae bacterium]